MTLQTFRRPSWTVSYSEDSEIILLRRFGALWEWQCLLNTNIDVVVFPVVHLVLSELVSCQLHVPSFGVDLVIWNAMLFCPFAQLHGFIASVTQGAAIVMRLDIM